MSFGIRADGEILGLKLLKSSGDGAFDESAVRAVRRANPLPWPPRSHLREFSSVEFTFKPDNSGG